MCGIVGLFAKSADVEQRLGAHLGAMLAQMADRGPDSAGVALYREPAPAGTTKYSLYSPDPREDWAALGDAEVHSSHAVVALADAEAERVLGERPQLQVVSAGRRIEMFKEAIDPREFVARFELDGIAGSHGLGHTRMATESKVTTAGAHPFSTGLGRWSAPAGGSRCSRRRSTRGNSSRASAWTAWRARTGSATRAWPPSPG